MRAAPLPNGHVLNYGNFCVHGRELHVKTNRSFLVFPIAPLKFQRGQTVFFPPALVQKKPLFDCKSTNRLRASTLFLPQSAFCRIRDRCVPRRSGRQNSSLLSKRRDNIWRKPLLFAICRSDDVCERGKKGDHLEKLPFLSPPERDLKPWERVLTQLFLSKIDADDALQPPLGLESVKPDAAVPMKEATSSQIMVKPNEP